MTLLDVIEDADLAWWTPEDDDEDGLCEVVLFGGEIDTFRDLVRTHDLTVRSQSRLVCLAEGLGDIVLVHWQPPPRQRALAIAAAVLDCENRAGQAFSDEHSEPIVPLTQWASSLTGHFDSEDPQFLGRVALVEALEAAGEFGDALHVDDPVAEVLGVLIADHWEQGRVDTSDYPMVVALLCTDPGIVERARLLARDTRVKVTPGRVADSVRSRS